MLTLDIIDRQLLNLLQSEFPLEPEPYRVLGAALGVSPQDTLDRVRRLRETGLIRYISGIFNPEKLDYHRALIAAKVPQENLARAISVIGAHPGVSHNYGRDHAYNMWFTLNLPSKEPLEEGAEALAAQIEAQAMLFLPTLRVFKIGVYFDMLGKRGEGIRLHGRHGSTKEKIALTAADIEAIRRLQDDLPDEERPFAPMAEAIGLTEGRFLGLARTFFERRIMRRFGAVLKHQQAGFTSNVMACWVAGKDEVEESGKAMAGFRTVSHCYERLTWPDWPYNLFTMIHDQTDEGCRSTAEEISKKTGINDYALLFTTAEYKRSRMRYFA